MRYSTSSAIEQTIEIGEKGLLNSNAFLDVPALTRTC